jgi:hypothetical protein
MAQPVSRPYADGRVGGIDGYLLDLVPGAARSCGSGPGGAARETNDMERRLQALLIVNGALVMLAGFAAGFPYATTVLASLAPGAEAGLHEPLRAWHMAHQEGVLNGLLMVAAAAAAGPLALSRVKQRLIFWGLIVAGWTNIVASTISALTGGRGTAATGLDWNTLDFTLFMAGILGAVAAVIALAAGALRTGR